MNTYYMPELGEATPAADIDVSRLHGTPTKYRLVTRLELPQMRGLTKEKTYQAQDLVPQAQHKVGSHVYIATAKALKVIENKYDTRQSVLLD